MYIELNKANKPYYNELVKYIAVTNTSIRISIRNNKEIDLLSTLFPQLTKEQRESMIEIYEDADHLIWS